MHKERIRVFAFLMALFMVVSSIDFTSFAAELTAEESVDIEYRTEDDNTDTMTPESEEDTDNVSTMVSENNETTGNELAEEVDAVDAMTKTGEFATVSAENAETEVTDTEAADAEVTDMKAADVEVTDTEDVISESEWTEETSEINDVIENDIAEKEELPEADISNVTISEEENIVKTDYGIANPREDARGYTIWDCVWFGHYWQNDTNGDGTADKSDKKEPVKWRVLSVSGNQALLLADKNLDCKQYNTESVDVTWETCTMRSWLNGYGAGSNDQAISYTNDSFIGTAFTTAEKNAIAATTLVNADNARSGTEGGNDTTDRVFLLSLDDVVNTAYGFSSDGTVHNSARRAANTDFAKSQGAWAINSGEFAGKVYWWLRSPGGASYGAAYVFNNGYAFEPGVEVDYSHHGARPALYLNLSSSSVWSYAGTVTARGTMDEIKPVPGGEDDPENYDILHKITFDADGGYTVGGEYFRLLANGDTYGKLPEARKTGYRFTGWVDENGNAITASAVVNLKANQTLTALYTKEDLKSYTITLDPDGGSLSSTTVTVYDESYIGELPMPSKEGLLFDGWYYGEERIIGSRIYRYGKDITLKAKYVETIFSSNDNCLQNVYLTPRKGVAQDILQTVYTADHSQKTSFDITVKVKDGVTIESFTLSSDKETIKQNTTGEFKNLLASDFPSYHNVYLGVAYVKRTPGQKPEVVSEQIMLKMNITNTALLSSFDGMKLNLGGDALFGLTIDEDIPVIGGEDLNFGFDAIPISAVVEDGKLQIGINLKAQEYDYTEGVVSSSNLISGFKKETIKDHYNKYISDLEASGGKMIDYAKGNYGEGGLEALSEQITSEMPTMKSKVSIAGYVMGEWSEHLDSISGELTLVIQPIECEKWIQINIVNIPVTVNIALGTELKATGKAGFDFNRDTFNGSVDLEGKIKINPYGGVGYKDILSGGVYGKTSIGLTAKLLDSEDKNNCGLKEASFEASVGFKGYFAGLESPELEVVNLSILKKINKISPYIDDKKLLLYSDSKVSLLGPVVANSLSEGESYSLEQIMADYYRNTEYLDEESSFMNAQASDFFGGANGIVVTDAYDGAEPALIQAGNDLYLFYLDMDTEESVSANQCSLYYAVYDEESGVFVNPKKVDEDGTADYKFRLITDGENVYVVYMDSSIAYEADEEVTLSAFISGFDISVAKVNAEGCSVLANYGGETYSYFPRIAISGNGLILAWVENSENNVFGADGTNTVKTAYYDGTDWSEERVVAEGLSCITSLAVTEGEDTGIITWAEDPDNDLYNTKMQNIESYTIDGTKLATVSASANDLQYVSVSENAYLLKDVAGNADAYGNLLVANENGGLVCFDQNLNKTAITETALIGTGNSFQVEDNKIYFMGAGDDCRNIYVAVKRKDSSFTDESAVSDSDDSLSNNYTVTVLTKETDYVDDFSVAAGKAVYLKSVVDMSSYDDPETENVIEKSCNICLIDNINTEELCLDNIYYNYKEIAPGQALPMDIYLSNTGTETVTYYELSLYPKGKEEEAVKYAGAVDIAPGTGVVVCTNIVLPKDLSEDTFVLKLSSDNALEGSDTMEISLGKTELAVDTEYVVTESGNAIRVIAANISYFPATATISVNDPDGKTIFTTKEEIDGLDYRFYDVELPADVIPADGVCMYTVTISTDKEEFNIDDNTCGQRIWNFEVEETEVVSEPMEGYYVVSFNACGGKIVSDNTASANDILISEDNNTAAKAVSVSENYGVLPAAEQEYNEFLGWFTDPVSGNQITAETKVTLSENQILYAHWKLLQYQVTFDANGGKIGESDTSVTVSSDGLTAVKTVVSNKPYGALPTVNREHYEFLGWFTTKDETKDSVAVSENALFKASADQTLYAHWKLKTYTLTFDGRGGKLTVPDSSVQLSADGLKASKTVASGQEYGSFAIAAREGFLFAGWYTKPEGGELVTEKTACSLTKDAVIYAQWNYITLVEKQKIEIKSFFEKEIQNYLGEDTKKKQYKYAVTKVSTIPGNKGSASVSGKTGILTAKRSGVVEIRLMTKNLETKKWETSDKYLTVVIEKPVVKKVSMTYVGQQINVDKFLSYQGKEYYGYEPNYCNITYEIAKPKAGKPEIAAVDANGNLTAVSTGTTKLTITYTNNYGAQKPSVIKKTVSISVKVPKFSKETLTVAAGKTGRNALKNVSSKSQSVAYSVDKPWAQIDAKGKVKVLPEAASGDTAEVTATVTEASGKENKYTYRLVVK